MSTLRRTAGVSTALLGACLLLWGGAGPAAAQLSPRELQTEANEKLARGDFLDAIPYLQQLILLLGESEKSHIVAAMEMVYYNLGICHFFVGQFPEAKEAFDNYCRKYRYGSRVKEAALYTADCLRFSGKFDAAAREYERIARAYRYLPDLEADIYCGLARCHLARGDWSAAVEPLEQVYRVAPDFLRRNWAATLLTTAYLKNLELERIYAIVPLLLRPDSFASRSIAFNMAALEAGDHLFADERYRDALWVYRLVYPHDLIAVRGEEYLERLRNRAELLRRASRDPRVLMRTQESIGELEEELKALDSIENYDLPLYFRIARGYMEMMRYWEGREIFLYLHDVAEPRDAEEALFLAFQCSSRILPWERAFEIGRQYMATYPAGEFYDGLTLLMGQMYAREQNWPRVIAHLTEALTTSPQHQSAAECMFLIGYASFMEEKFEDAARWLSDMNTKYPDNELRDESTYWLGMTLLFDRKYEEAAREFDTVLEDFPDCLYVQDTAFRRAVCEYGMENFEESDRRLQAFIEAYPDSALAGEALMMRGDIAGAVGRLEDAVAFYQRAMQSEDLNIEFYNHCAFQCGRILYEGEHYEALRSHFAQYVRVRRAGVNIPQAVYWIGVSLWNTGEQAGAMRYYRQAVETYGGRPDAIGVDMILDEWVGRARSSTPGAAAQAWDDLRAALARAEEKGRTTLALRLQRALLLNPDVKPSERERALQRLSSERYIEAASPAVLQTMLTLASARKDEVFAETVARQTVQAFTETDYALDARMFLARAALSRARAAASPADARADYAEAVKHLEVISEVFAASGDAGEALMRLGQIHREEGDYAKADETYKSVLGVKGWRNYWPEALYGRGECAFQQHAYEAAAGYYERIYVLYSHYRDWTAKAYLRRAECLQKMYQIEKAREVLTEMLAIGELGDLPETEEARALLARIGDQT